MPSDREGRRTNDPPPKPGENGVTAPSSPATGRGPTRRRVLLTTAGAGLASIAGVGRTRATQTTGGDELWRFESGNTGVSSPTVVDGTVYVTSTIDDDCALHALNATDGDELWHWEFYNPSAAPGAPTVVDGTVFVPAHGVYAVDQETGEKQWQTEKEGSYRFELEASPTVANGMVFAGYGNVVDVFNAAVGKHLWSGPKEGPQSWSKYPVQPVVVDETVYLTGSDVVAYDAVTGDDQWQWDAETVYGTAPTVADGTVFAAVRYDSSQRGVCALDAETGEELWRFSADRRIDSSPTVAGDTLFVGSDEDILAIDVIDGEARRLGPIGTDLSSPTVVGDTLFANDGDGYVYALNIGDGSVRWRFETDGGGSKPIVVDGTLYVGNADGTVYALDAGVDGSSEDSRALLGTQGHHHAWANEASADVAPDEFAVEIDVDPVPAIRGEPIEERVTIENVGGQPGERELRYSGAAEHFEETIELEGGESRTISVSGTFDEHHPWDDVTLTATVYEDEAELTIPVKNPPTMLDRIPGGEGFATVGVFGSATYLIKWLYDGERP